MKVRILTNVSDLSGVHQAGDEPDLVDERAAEYVKSGIAEEMAPPPEALAAHPGESEGSGPRARGRG